MGANASKDDLERLKKEREFFRTQYDDLGARVLRLQEEQWRAHRDARRWRTTAKIIGEAYRAAEIGTPLETVATRILATILDNVMCDRAAFLQLRSANQFSVKHALGYWEEARLESYPIGSPPGFACVSSRTPPDGAVAELQAVIGLPFVLWCFDAASGCALILGSRSEANVARPFEEDDRPIVEGALGVFLDIREKDRLLQERSVMAEELKHRVRNNLQVVYGMLSNELARSGDQPVNEGIARIARRVLTMAQVYDHLLGKGLSREVDFGEYLQALCAGLAEFHSSHAGRIELVCSLRPAVFVDLDTVTAIGLAVSELVSNSYEHAFPEGGGTICVNLSVAADGRRAILAVSDDGIGFVDAPGSKLHGLGLVRRLVAQGRGTMDMRSDRGTICTVDLPISRVSAPPG